MADGITPALQESLDNSKCEYKRLGKSGLKISCPVMGAMSYGDSRWQEWVINEEEALPLIKAAYDRGLNSWDTANVYSAGHSEMCIAKAIKKYNIPRHKVVIMTKCNFPVTEEFGIDLMKHLQLVGTSKDYVNQRGLSRAAIFNQVEASLKRLETDYIDLLQIHRFDKEVPIEETMEALHDLVKSGKVRYIGASSMWTYQFAQMQFVAETHGWTKFVSMQNHYSLLYREEEREMNRYCNETGVGLIPWAPLCRGHLARPASAFGESSRSAGEKQAGKRGTGPTFEADLKIIERVEEIAKKRDWKMSQVALAWINKRVASPIVGFSSVERMDEAIGSNGKTLTDEEEKYLEEPYQAKEVQGHS